MLAGDCPHRSRAPPSLPRGAGAHGGSGRIVAFVADVLDWRRDSAGNRSAGGGHMADPLARAGAIDLLEEAVHTLRAAPLSTILAHWIGSVPFVLGLLVFWNDMAQPRTSDAACAFEALALALLLVWMNCWRAVFAGRLDRQLGGRPELPWTRRRLWRLVSSQAFFGGTKPVAMALAVGLILPLPWMAAFYRTAAAFADGGDMDLSQLAAQARKLAGFEQRQGWGILDRKSTRLNSSHL